MRRTNGGPDWFNLAKYSDLPRATLEEWLIELTNRKFCFSFLTRAKENEKLRRSQAFAKATATWQAVRDAGSLTQGHREILSKFRASVSTEERELAEQMAAIETQLRAQRDAYLAEQGEPAEQGSLVTRLTKGDVLMRFLLAGELEDLAAEVDETDSFPHGLLSPAPIDAIGSSGAGEHFCFLKVNLSAPDVMVKRELDAWLSAERQRQVSSGTLTPRIVTPEDFADWCRFRVLPYMDLAFAARYDGLRLTQQRIGDLLFPDELDVSVAERIRKVTRPKALAMLSDSFISGMRHQFEQESGAYRNG